MVRYQFAWLVAVLIVCRPFSVSAATAELIDVSLSGAGFGTFEKTLSPYSIPAGVDTLLFDIAWIQTSATNRGRFDISDLGQSIQLSQGSMSLDFGSGLIVPVSSSYETTVVKKFSRSDGFDSYYAGAGQAYEVRNTTITIPISAIRAENPSNPMTSFIPTLRLKTERYAGVDNGGSPAAEVMFKGTFTPVVAPVVYLNFYDPAPVAYTVELVLKECDDGSYLRPSYLDRDRTTPPAYDSGVYEDTRKRIQSRLEEIYSVAGVDVIFTTDPTNLPDNYHTIYFGDAPHIRYFTSSILGGEAYTGAVPRGEAIVFVNEVERLSLDRRSSDLDLAVAEVAAHELGHLFGLRHISTEAQDAVDAIMNYQYYGSSEASFVNKRLPISETVEKDCEFVPYLTGETHNPLYYLKHYVQGIPRETLIADKVFPGSYDLEPKVGQANIRLTISTATDDLVLHDLKILVISESSFGGPHFELIERVEEIALSELDSLLFKVDVGQQFILLASSLPDLGEVDVFLSAYSGGTSPETLGVYPGDSNAVELWKSDAPGGGYSLLGQGWVRAVSVPEPIASQSLPVALLVVALRRRMRFCS